MNLGSICLMFEPFAAGVDFTQLFLTSARSLARPFLSPSPRPEMWDTSCCKSVSVFSQH